MELQSLAYTLLTALAGLGFGGGLVYFVRVRFVEMGLVKQIRNALIVMSVSSLFLAFLYFGVTPV